jgi:hypothetical protein
LFPGVQLALAMLAFETDQMVNPFVSTPKPHNRFRLYLLLTRCTIEDEMPYKTGKLSIVKSASAIYYNSTNFA